MWVSGEGQTQVATIRQASEFCDCRPDHCSSLIVINCNQLTELGDCPQSAGLFEYRVDILTEQKVNPLAGGSRSSAIEGFWKWPKSS
jgi:hypothetical protein